jgi:hypothetical protein
MVFIHCRAVVENFKSTNFNELLPITLCHYRDTELSLCGLYFLLILDIVALSAIDNAHRTPDDVRLSRRTEPLRLPIRQQV